MFYENYVSYCKKIGKSQTEVARQIGKSSKSVTGWKNGAVPRNDTLKKLADYFGITVEELMGEKKESAGQGGLDEQLKVNLLAAFDQLNEEGQTKVVGYAEDLCRTGYYKKHSTSGVAARGA